MFSECESQFPFGVCVFAFTKAEESMFPKFG